MLPADLFEENKELLDCKGEHGVKTLINEAGS